MELMEQLVPKARTELMELIAKTEPVEHREQTVALEQMEEMVVLYTTTLLQL